VCLYRRSTEEVRDTTRRARIESEQRRRDEQKDGFDALRAVLPPTNQRPSKTLTLDRSE
jgi:23S rRNA A2030 N6-methylase RlmJ